MQPSGSVPLDECPNDTSCVVESVKWFIIVISTSPQNYDWSMSLPIIEDMFTFDELLIFANLGWMHGSYEGWVELNGSIPSLGIGWFIL